MKKIKCHSLCANEKKINIKKLSVKTKPTTTCIKYQ